MARKRRRRTAAAATTTNSSKLAVVKEDMAITSMSISSAAASPVLTASKKISSINTTTKTTTTTKTLLEKDKEELESIISSKTKSIENNLEPPMSQSPITTASCRRKQAKPQRKNGESAFIYKNRVILLFLNTFNLTMFCFDISFN